VNLYLPLVRVIGNWLKLNYQSLVRQDASHNIAPFYNRDYPRVLQRFFQLVGNNPRVTQPIKIKVVDFQIFSPIDLVKRKRWATNPITTAQAANQAARKSGFAAA